MSCMTKIDTGEHGLKMQNYQRFSGFDKPFFLFWNPFLISNPKKRAKSESDQNRYREFFLQCTLFEV